MRREYKLINVKSPDFSYKLHQILETNSLSGSYELDEINNIIVLDANEEIIGSDLIALKDAINEIDSNVSVELLVKDEVYRKVLTLENLDCANCAAKVERLAARYFDNESVYVDFATTRFVIETKDKDLYDNLEERLQLLTKNVDRNIIVVGSKKENFVARERERPDHIPPIIVAPDREVPGIIDNVWNSPILIAFFQERLSCIVISPSALW